MSFSITYYGHSTLVIEVDGTRLIVDPFLAPNNPLSPVGPDAIQADYILQTHGHGDHIADTVGIAKRTNAQVICNFEIANWLQNLGVSNIHPMHLGGALEPRWKIVDSCHSFGNIGRIIHPFDF